MYLFKTKQIICIAGFLLLGFLSQAQNNQNANKIYIQWQSSNCGINNDNALIRLLIENASIMEPQLRKGFRDGPPSEYLETAMASEIKRMRINRKLISEGKIETGLSKEDLQVVSETNPDSALVDIKRRIVNGWKTRALTGLSYLNTDESKQLLERLSQDESSEFSAFAKYLLTQDRN